MDRFLSFAICLIAVLFPRGADGTAFVLDEMTCSYPVNLYVENVKCGSSSGDACNFGDLLYVDGTVGLDVSLDSSTMCSTVKACFLGSTLFCKTYTAQIDLCNDLGLTSMDGTACPNAADYNFEAKLQLPGQGAYQLGTGWWITTVIIISDCDSGKTSFDCNGSFTAVSTASTNVATGALLLGIGALAYAVARKRRVATIDLAKEEEFLEGNFAMLPDQSVKI